MIEEIIEMIETCTDDEIALLLEKAREIISER
jgi:hypothetical protein